MILYLTIAFFLFFGVFFGSLRYRTDDNKYQLCRRNDAFISLERMYFIVFLSIFAFLTAMRSVNIGNDTETYVKFFNYFCKYGAAHNFFSERGYVLFCLCVARFTADPHHFLIITSLLFYGLIALYSFRNSSNLYITICLIFCFCFAPLTNILRQDFAMVICLFAYQALTKNKKVIFALLVLLASQFHMTALCMFSLPIFKYLPSKKTNVLLTGLILILVSCLGNMSSLFAQVFTMYESYFEGNRVGTGWLGTSFGVIRAYLIYFIVADEMKIFFKKNSILYSNFWALIIFSSLGFQMNLFNRCALFFLFITITELPNSIMIVKGNRSFYKILLFCGVMLLSFLLILIVRPEWNYLVPYEMW